MQARHKAWRTACWISPLGRLFRKVRWISSSGKFATKIHWRAPSGKHAAKACQAALLGFAVAGENDEEYIMAYCLQGGFNSCPLCPKSHF